MVMTDYVRNRKTSERPSPVWHVKSAIDGALQCAKDARPRRGAHQSDIEVAPEGTGLAVDALHHVLRSVHLLRPRVQGIQLELLQQLHQKENKTFIFDPKTHQVNAFSQIK